MNFRSDVFWDYLAGDVRRPLRVLERFESRVLIPTRSTPRMSEAPVGELAHAVPFQYCPAGHELLLVVTGLLTHAVPLQYCPAAQELAGDVEESTHADPFQYWLPVQELPADVTHAVPFQYCPAAHEV